jgi:integrase
MIDNSEVKIDLATEGLEPYNRDHLKTRISIKNSMVIAEYILSMRVETNLSDNHRRGVITSLKILSEFVDNKPFIEMTREDILRYLESLRKSDHSDSLHRWVSTYNQRLIAFLRFFKWLYYPAVDPSKRQKPHAVDNIPIIKRKEKSVYQPSDLWTEEDHIVFLRYCVNKRDRCYHAMAVDTSCRPHEILTLKIKDVTFKMAGDRQYAEVVVNGKTGSRVIPLFNSIPFVKDWIEDHPRGRNPHAVLFCGLGKRMGRQLSRYAIYDIYEHYKKKVFPSLLEDPNIPKEDKYQLSKLLNKPFNPYILRHSTLTQKATVLKEHVLRQHAGWTMNSKMPQIYVHWFGNESSNTLLELYGITKDQKPSEKLKPKQCPNCSEPNKIDSMFCSKCRMVLSYNAYTETIQNQEEKDNRLDVIEKQFTELKSYIESVVSIFPTISEAGRRETARKLIEGRIYAPIRSESSN